jgi:hypothetical protein
MTATLRKIVLPVAAVTLVAGLALASQGHNLQRRVKVDDVSRFRVKATLELMGEKAVFNGLVTQKVTKVEPSGDFTVEAIESNKSVTIGADEYPTEPSPPSRTIYRSNGEILRIEGREVTREIYRIASVNTFYAPTKEVGVGDTWSHELKANNSTGVRAAHAHYVVEAAEKVGERDTLRISFTFKESSGDNPIVADGKVWVSPQDGEILRREYTFKNFPSPDGSTITGTMSIVRE